MKRAHAKIVPRDVSEEEELDAGAGVGAIVGAGVKDGYGVAPGLGVSAGDGVSAVLVCASTLEFGCTKANIRETNTKD